MGAHGYDMSYDVVISGAGTSGAATAMLLARNGLEVLLVGAPPPTLPVPYLPTVPLTRVGVLLLTRWGLLDAIAAAGVPAVRRATFAVGDDVVEIKVKRTLGIEALYAPSHALLETLLRRAGADAGVDWHPDETLERPEIRHGRVVGAQVRRSDGTVRTVSASLV